MKCWNSALFNAQGSRVTIVLVQVRAVKIYVEAGAQEKGKTGWNSVYHTKIDGKN
jgi:hypothetical protein